MAKADKGDFIRRYTSIAAAIDILARGQLPLLNPETWDDRNDRHFMNLYKDSRAEDGVESLYALCAATCPETYHHWRVFTSGADGACLELRRAPLEDALRKMPNVRFEEVKYLTLEKAKVLTPDDLARLPFIKRHAFKPEAEYRIVLESEEPQSSAISIDLPVEWIGRIYLNPWLPAPLAESVIHTLKQTGGEALEVHRSHLIDNSQWKRAGDRVAGIQPVNRKVLKLKVQEALAVKPPPKAVLKVKAKPQAKAKTKT